MDRRYARGFNAAAREELWERWRRGESLKAIGRAFGKPSSSIYFQVAPRGLRKAGPGIRLSEHLNGDGETIFRHACALGAEGIIAKRRDRPYRSGRCADWVKVKNPDAPAAMRVIER